MNDLQLTTGQSLVFCLALCLNQTPVCAGDAYFIKLKTHPDTGTTTLVQEHAMMHSHSKLVGLEAKKILENNEEIEKKDTTMRAQRVDAIQQISLAMHKYHEATKALPPAGISGINDPNGKPLLSWRVAILPYIEQDALYRQFDLNQPWDHPTNKKLIARMPAIYKLPGTATKEGETHYRVLVGPGTMFEPRKGPGGQQIGWSFDGGIPDGSGNTIMAVEAKESTIWTRPDDLPYDPKGPLPKFGVSPDHFFVLMGDGSARFIRSTTPEKLLRAMITRNGGEVVIDP